MGPYCNDQLTMIDLKHIVMVDNLTQPGSNLTGTGRNVNVAIVTKIYNHLTGLSGSRILKQIPNYNPTAV